MLKKLSFIILRCTPIEICLIWNGEKLTYCCAVGCNWLDLESFIRLSLFHSPCKIKLSGSPFESSSVGRGRVACNFDLINAEEWPICKL